MVAAPESVQAQVAAEQQQHQQQRPRAKLASKDGAAPSANDLRAEIATSMLLLPTTGQVDDLTVVDHQNALPHAPSPYRVTSHNSNFDPTPATQPQTNLPPRDVAKLIPCRYFPQGACKYGDSCIFSHGIPGVAGSPGVAPSPSVQAQLLPASTQTASPQLVLHQQPQHFPPQQDEYLHGMPIYYPEQHVDQYGYPHHHHHHQQQQQQQQQQPFSPQGAFYPFFPPFYGAHHYQQAPPPPPQAFYHVPQAQQPSPAPQASSTLLSSESQAFSPTPTERTTASTPALASIEPQPVAASPTAAAFPSLVDGSSAPSRSGASPLPSDPTAAGRIDHALALAQSAVFSTSPFSADHATLPPLHAVFQNGNSTPNGLNGSTAPSGRSSVTTPVSGAVLSNGKSAPRNGITGTHGTHHLPNGPRLRGPMLGPAGGFSNMNNGKPARRNFPAGSPRPPCSFFEANRCRNRDACPFQHLLSDGSDARLLGQGWVGADGRTDNPEEKGGLPATWLANPNWKKTGGNGAYFRNGAQNPLAAFTHGARQQRNRFEEEQARLRADTQAQVAAAGHNGGVSESSAGVPGVSSVLAANVAPLPPGGAAPHLVAAIHGLTRRIPPVQTRDAQTPHVVVAAHNGSKVPAALTNGEHNKASSASSHATQRVPSGEDFPALTSGPSSPSLEWSVAPLKVATASQPATPPPPVALEASAEVQVVDVPCSHSTMVDSEFVMINHSDAPVSEIAGTPSTETSSRATAPAPVFGRMPLAAPPRIVGSFASAAARGASVVLPEKPKKTAPLPTTNLATDTGSAAAAKDRNDTSASKKGGKPALKKPPASAAASSTTPVAVKA
ncbi:BQ2448_3386 [Microbotryum intermedium]|uniref:BQ2448_3386 protein n=1 Tax=Microbotryum intermedium TaxID=269621 RepID=A0A238FFH6_9BASI|nr:BQ2448_3386 [Microbotryum intermedium]